MVVTWASDFSYGDFLERKVTSPSVEAAFQSVRCFYFQLADMYCCQNLICTRG